MRTSFSTTFCNSYGQYTVLPIPVLVSPLRFLATLLFQNMPNNNFIPQPRLRLWVLPFLPLSHLLVRSMCPSKRRAF